MSIAVSASFILHISSFIDNTVDILEVLCDEWSQMVSKLQLVVKDLSSEILICRCLVAASPSVSLYQARDLLCCKFRQSASYTIGIYVPSFVVDLLVLLLEYLQLVLIACLVEKDYVRYKKCVVWQLYYVRYSCSITPASYVSP